MSSNRKAMATGFVENEGDLKEDISSEDLFGYQCDANRFSEQLKQLGTNPSIIAFVGSYGIGKSFVLNLSKKLLEGRHSCWFKFEAWRYSDRSQLWRAFVSEFDDYVISSILSRETSQFAIGCMYLKIKKYVKNKISSGEASLLGLIAAILLLAIPLAYLFGLSLLSVLAFIVSVFILVFSVNKLYLDNPLHLQKGSEAIFKDVIRSLKDNGYENVYVVLEDVDRSGDKGLLFLETLAFFLRHQLNTEEVGELSLHFIIPVSNQSFIDKEQRAAFMKAVDYFYPFSVNNLNICQYVDKVFKKEFATERMKRDMETLFEKIIFRWPGASLDIRIWKTIIRGANSKYKYLKQEKKFNVQPLVCIVVEMMKHYRIDIGKENETTLFERCLDSIVAVNCNDPIIQRIIKLLICHHYDLGIHDLTMKAIGKESRAPAKLSGHLVIHNKKLKLSKADTGLFIKETQSRTDVSIARCYFDEYFYEIVGIKIGSTVEINSSCVAVDQ